MPTFSCAACGVVSSLQNFNRHQCVNHLFCTECNVLTNRRHACFNMAVEGLGEGSEAVELSRETVGRAEEEIARKKAGTRRPSMVFVPLSMASETVAALKKTWAARALGGGSFPAASYFALGLIRDACSACSHVSQPTSPPSPHTCRLSVHSWLEANGDSLCHLFNIEPTRDVLDQLTRYLDSSTF